MNARPILDTLRVVEIYASVQGESTWQGLPCVFVRLAGCNLRCTWCDSAFTFTGGEHRTIEAIVAQACSYGIDLIEVTGGEPLVHEGASTLMQALLDAGKTVLLETSGSRDIAVVPDGVHVIMDLKAPGSGEEAENLWENLAHLDEADNIKIVLASRADYEWARDVVRQHALDSICPVLFSPAWSLLDPAELAGWMVADNVPARLQLQLHKVLWGDARAR